MKIYNVNDRLTEIYVEMIISYGQCLEHIQEEQHNDYMHFHSYSGDCYLCLRNTHSYTIQFP